MFSLDNSPYAQLSNYRHSCWLLTAVSVPPTPSYQQGTPCWARQHSCQAQPAAMCSKRHSREPLPLLLYFPTFRFPPSDSKSGSKLLKSLLALPCIGNQVPVETPLHPSLAHSRKRGGKPRVAET